MQQMLVCAVQGTRWQGSGWASMNHGLRWRVVEAFAAACAIAIALTASGCSLLTPSIGNSGGPTSRGPVPDSALVSAGTLTVGLVEDDAPQAMLDDHGHLQGYTVDVARAIAEQLRLNVSFVSTSSANSALTGRKVDVYLGVAPTGAHGAITSVGGYLSSAVSLFGKTKGATKPSASDLSSASIGVQRASASQSALEHSGVKGTVTAFKNVNECLEALESGKVDYIACDATAGAYLCRRYADISFTGTIAAPRQFEALVSPTDVTLAKNVRSTVKKLSSNGVLEAIHTQWFGDLPMDLNDQIIAGVTPDATANAESAGNGELPSRGDGSDASDDAGATAQTA